MKLCHVTHDIGSLFLLLLLIFTLVFVLSHIILTTSCKVNHKAYFIHFDTYPLRICVFPVVLPKLFQDKSDSLPSLFWKDGISYPLQQSKLNPNFYFSYNSEFVLIPTLLSLGSSRPIGGMIHVKFKTFTCRWRRK
jgi:hypothetical protein